MSASQRTYLLVADVTEGAAAAARWLGEAARADRGARVVVLHVFDPAEPAVGWRQLDEAAEPVDVSMENQRRAAFANVLPALGLGAERLSQVSRVGERVAEIIAVARAQAADAIILADADVVSWRRVLRPTLAARLKRGAPCPVVSVAMATAA